MKKEPTRNYKKAIILTIIGLTVFTSHVFLTKGSADFITNLFHGDFISVSNMFMTGFVLMGWFLVYKYLGKLL